MKTSARLYSCCRCHAQTIICRRCDRGQRYCNKVCSDKARSESLQRAAKKYQASRAGHFNNAQRQQRYRARKKQKVTHQCSIEMSVHDVLKPTVNRSFETKQFAKNTSILICHHCKSVCGPFLRHDFVDRTRFERPFRRRPK